MAVTSKPIRNVIKKIAKEQGREKAKEWKKDIKEYSRATTGSTRYKSPASAEKKAKKVSDKYSQINAPRYHPHTDDEIPKTQKQKENLEKLKTKTPKSQQGKRFASGKMYPRALHKYHERD